MIKNVKMASRNSLTDEGEESKTANVMRCIELIFHALLICSQKSARFSKKRKIPTKRFELMSWRGALYYVVVLLVYRLSPILFLAVDCNPANHRQ